LAGADLSEMGQYLPQFLPLGIAGGLTGAQTAGLWAYATTRTGSPEKATVGIRNIFMALRGKGTPESQELLQRLGIGPEMNIFEQLSALSAAQKKGGVGLTEAETIAGKENAALLMSMLTKPAAMMESVSDVTKADRPDIDIVKDKLNKIMGQDEIARLEEEGRQLGIEIQNIKGRDVKALKMNIFLKQYEKQMREAGVPEGLIGYQLRKYELAFAFGAEPKRHPFLEPHINFTSETPEYLPEEKMPTEQGTPVNIIHDHSTKNYPVVGSEADRGVGPRNPPGVQ